MVDSGFKSRPLQFKLHGEHAGVSNEEMVLEKWPDASISTAFAVQPDGSRKWMYCVMSSLKFARTRARKGNPRVANVGPWRFSQEKAWADAVGNIGTPEAMKRCAAIIAKI